MRKVEKLKLRKPVIIVLKILGFLLCSLLVLFIIYRNQINDLKKLGYSEEASTNILFSKNKEYVMSVGENKTLNSAFESEKIIEEYLDNYVKINYVDYKDLIDNINNLIKKGYSNSDINIILKHGNNEEVKRFSNRDKVKYLEEFYLIDYAKLDYYDRYMNYSDETGEDEETTVLHVNLDMDKPAYEDAFLVEDFSIDMLVNKRRCLSESFEPDDLIKINEKYASSDDMYASRLSVNAFIEMHDAALKEGYEIVINSAYRSYQDQQDIIDLYLGVYGQKYVDNYVAKPGFSEHQTGLAFDIGSRKVNVFANSEEYKWMLENSYKYGFIYRFPKRYENITGFRSEPWHFRYVGKDIAKYIYENNITLEEYYAIFLDK